MQKILILFSGGKDSLLTTLLYLEKGFETYLIFYENGCGLNSKGALATAKRIQKKYKEKVKILGIKNISPIFRELLCDYYNFKTSEILKNYGEIPISQFNCLSCRLSMYIASIIICKKHDIFLVADGARESQKFAIEQEKILNNFINFFKDYKIDILFPLKDLKNNFELKNQILIRGIIPKTYEPQCLLGMPIKKELDKNIIDSISILFEKLLKRKACEIINRYKDIEIAGEFY